MSFNTPSKDEFKLLGQILFYALILPACFYYLWQGLKFIFNVIVGAGEGERQPLQDAGDEISTSPKRPLFFRVKKRGEPDFQSKNYDLTEDNKNCVLSAKQTLSDIPELKDASIDEVEFFYQKPTSSLTLLPQACKRDPNKIYIVVKMLSSPTEYYFEFINGKSDPNNLEQIGKQDIVSEGSKKMAQKMYGKAMEMTLISSDKDLETTRSFGDYFSNDSQTSFSVVMKFPWKAGYQKEDHEDLVLNVKFGNS